MQSNPKKKKKKIIKYIMMASSNAKTRPVMDRVKEEIKCWCRLCARVGGDNALDIFLVSQVKSAEDVNIISAIKKYFGIAVMREKYLPQVVCTECLSILKPFMKYALRVNKVQEMYEDIQNLTKNAICDLHILREKYGLNHKALFMNDEASLAAEATANIYKEHTILPKVPVTASTSISCDEETNTIHQSYDEDDPLDQNSEMDLYEAPQNSISPSYDDSILAREKAIALIKEEQHVEEDDKGSIVNESNIIGTAENKIKWEDDPPSQNEKTKRSYKRATIEKYPILTEQHVYNCTTCLETFQRKGELSKHKKSAHEMKLSVICEECGKSFSSKSSLIDHMYTHSKDAPFKCKDCGKRFKHKGFLNKHKSIHGDKHICAECGLQLNSRATLYNHLLVHSDVKRHKCDYCGRAYKRSKTLKNHLMVHSGLRPYACDFCHKTFTHPTTCRQHKKNIHPKEFAAQEASGEKPQRAENVPKLATLKEVTRTAKNLAPVIHKPNSGNYSIGGKKKRINEEDLNTNQYRKRLNVNNGSVSKNSNVSHPKISEDG